MEQSFKLMISIYGKSPNGKHHVPGSLEGRFRTVLCNKLRGFINDNKRPCSQEATIWDPSLHPSERNIYIKIIQVLEAEFHSNSPNHQTFMFQGFWESPVCECSGKAQKSRWDISWCRRKVCCSLVAKSCPFFCHPMGCSPPGSSVHGIFQARILEWVAIFSSRESSQSRDHTWVSCIIGEFFITEPPGKPREEVRYQQ